MTGGAGAAAILVVKLGALGNVVLSLGPFAAIRRHHADAHITLLTTAPYADWLARVALVRRRLDRRAPGMVGPAPDGSGCGAG